MLNMKLILTLCLVLLAFSQSQARTRIIDGIINTDRNTAVIFNVDFKIVCSGAIIHPEWILTSALCVKKTIENEMRIVVKGDVDVAKLPLDFNNAHLIKQKIINGNFNPDTLVNDIGLLQIETHIDGNARELKIPIKNPNVDGQRCVVKGFGSNARPPAALNGKLYQKTVITVDNKRCIANGVNMANKICTYEQVACVGDQGGPLINTEDNTVIGIVSIIDGQAAVCSLTGILNFTPYTNVFLYRDWIRNQIKGYF